ncbi:9788_t:CDS:2, partial [Diversispora eburnea]
RQISPDEWYQVSTVSEQPSNTVSALITSEEIDRKIQTAIASLENQKSESNKIRSNLNLYSNNMDYDPSFFQNLKNVMEDISNRLSNHEVIVSSKGKKNNSSSSDDIDAITKGMAELSLNLVKTSKVIKKSLRRCSICNKVSHTSHTCPKKKKSKRKTRVNHINKNDSSDSENDSSGSDSGSSSSSKESEVESDHSFDVHLSKSKKKVTCKKNFGKSSSLKPKQSKVKKEEIKFWVSPSKSCKESQSKQTILEQTIRKIIQSELNEIIPPYLLQSFKPKFSSI